MIDLLKAIIYFCETCLARALTQVQLSFFPNLFLNILFFIYYFIYSVFCVTCFAILSSFFSFVFTKGFMSSASTSSLCLEFF